MPNLFDNIQKAAFGIVTTTMGYDASWSPSVGSEMQEARVLLKEPTREEELLGIDYSPVVWITEWHYPDFAGLFEATRNGKVERITIGADTYRVRAVTTIYDGKTYKAVLQKET